MTLKLFWLGSALGAALLANGCSSSTDNGDGGTTTTTTGASTTGHGTTNGTTGQATTTGGGSTTTTTGGTTTTAGTTGTTTTTTTTTTGGTTTGTGTTTGGGTTTTTTTGGTTGGGVVVGTPCDATANPDTTCAPSGYYCMPTDTLGNGTCQIPIEFFPCNDTVGCATGLTCTAGFVDNNNNPISICVQECTATLDCLDPITSCIPGGSGNICFYNACGGTSGNGDGAYLACNSAGTNDGTCFPPFGDATLVCGQAGPIASYQPCGNTRANGDVATLCVEGDTCTTFGGTATACLQMCPTGAPTFPDGGPGCADGFDCLSFGANLGICLQECVDSSTCPSPLTCQNIGLTPMYCAP